MTGVDDEGTEDTDSGDHTIVVTDFAPVIDIVKTGPATIDEGGEDVTWHFGDHQQQRIDRSDHGDGR